MKKVEKVAKAKFAQWNGEMNPSQVVMNSCTAINVNDAEIDDENSYGSGGNSEHMSKNSDEEQK